MLNFSQFQKPQRYIGNEHNVIKKDHSGKIKICIAYPNLYEIGMSNLGLRIIYGLLNEFSDVVCERVFLPGEDLCEYLTKNGKKLFSLETKTNLDEFDVIGFNLNYELNFINFLQMLHLGGIPLDARERSDIIILGGGIANPEPLAKFVDIFCLGEFEAFASEFIEVLRKHKDKESRLKRFCEIDGLYVPKFYFENNSRTRYNLEKSYSYAKLPLKRLYVKNLDSAYYPAKWLTPHTAIVHDRVAIEIARGCPNSCTFCQAKALYYPYREKKPATVISLIKQIYQNSGYGDFSLLALSASDYSQINFLTKEIVDYFNDKKVGLSLPSLRLDDIISGLYAKILPLKKTSLTVAVEAASEFLRKKLNKNIDINKIFEAAGAIRALHLKHMKIYFMFGFTEEVEEDLTAIGRFLEILAQEAKIALNVSINIFSPKPFSVWQNHPMDSEDILRKKSQTILKGILSRRSISVSLSPIKKSILETILCRGDRKLGDAIKRAFLSGAKSDDAGPQFSWPIWEAAFIKENIDYHFYLEAKTENFPWSFINTD